MLQFLQKLAIAVNFQLSGLQYLFINLSNISIVKISN